VVTEVIHKVLTTRLDHI